MLANGVSHITSHDFLLIIVTITLIVISVTMVYLVYSQKINEKLEEKNKKKNAYNEMIELKELSKKLENISPTNNANLTKYEEEQEERAIISYDELLKNKNNVSIGYESTELKDDIEVKKIDLDSTGEIELDPIKRKNNSKVTLVSYEHEEEFLKSLKELQYLLNK